MKNWHYITLVLILFLLVIYGCASRKKEIIVFTHKAHTAKGINCKACHITVLKGDKAGMPKESKCAYCHETVYSGISVKSIYTLKEWKNSREEALSIFKDVNFSHKRHISYGKECSDCHKNAANSESITTEHIPNANTCVQCHSEWLNQKLCSKCHEKTRLNTPPDNHKRPDFMLAHGGKLKERPFNNWLEDTGRHNHLCFQCHNKERCFNCHNEIEPQDHTNEWRLAGHGVSAGINRNRCQACHRVDFCFRCHEEMRPINHVANWGSTRSEHCGHCHEPLSSSRCAACHKGTPSHRKAPVAPDFVRKGWPCRACHYTIVPLDHFDNGEDCENCHKTTRPSRRQERRRDRLRENFGITGFK